MPYSVSFSRPTSYIPSLVSISVPAPSSFSPSHANVHPMQTQSKSRIVKPKRILSLSMCLVEVEPTNFKQASQHRKWREAVSEKYNALISNNAWELVPPQPT